MSSSPFSEPAQPLFSDAGVFSDTRESATGELLRGGLAVVTGATGPLGTAIAAALAEAGAAVCLLGWDRSALTAARSLMPEGSRAPMLVCDLADGDDIDAAMAFVARLGRPVDVVVHAAGLQEPSSVSDAPVETLDDHYLLNVRGPYLLTQRLLPLMPRGRGRLVFFGISPMSGEADAHATITRAAVAAMAAELRREVTAHGLGVIEVEASVGSPARGDDLVHDDFVDALAATVVEAVTRSPVEVTELRVRPPSLRNRRSER